MIDRVQFLTKWLNITRIRQWHKNGFVLLGFFALGDYGNHALFLDAVVVALAFCFASSATYIFNDFLDVEADREHPLKKKRPLAAGTIKTGWAIAVSILLALAALVTASRISDLSAFFVAAYLLNNLLYSLLLKNRSIIDVVQLALGFMLRLLAGTVAVGIQISDWMTLTGFLVSLLIGFSKRYSELSNHSNSLKARKVLKKYSVEALRIFIAITAAATIMTYALYTLSPSTIEMRGHSHLMYTVPIVIFGVFRFLHIILHNRGGEDPASLLFRDQQLLAAVIMWITVFALMVR